MSLMEMVDKNWATRAVRYCRQAGLTIDDEGVKLGADTVIAKTAFSGHGRVGLELAGRELHILALLSAAYDEPVSPDVLRYFRSADRFSRQGNRSAAIISLAYSGLGAPPTSDGREVMAKRLAAAETLLGVGVKPADLLDAWGFGIVLRKYDPNEPRIPAGSPEGGQWTTGGAGQGGGFASAYYGGQPHDLYGTDGVSAPIIDIADFSGGFHQAVVNAWVAEAKKQGWPIVDTPAIRVIGPNNSVVGYPDLIIKRPDGTLEVVEIKTGGDPPLTPMQQAYIPAMQVGGHIYSTDPRIEALGLKVGVPFPPMKAAIAFAPGPGLPYEIIQLPPPSFEP